MFKQIDLHAFKAVIYLPKVGIKVNKLDDSVI